MSLRLPRLSVLLAAIAACIALAFPARADYIVDNFDDNNLTAENWGNITGNWEFQPGYAAIGVRAALDTFNGLYTSTKKAALYPFNGGYAYRMADSIAVCSATSPDYLLHSISIAVNRVDDFDASAENYIRFTAYYDGRPVAASVKDSTINATLVGLFNPSCAPFQLCFPNLSVGPWNEDGTALDTARTMSGDAITSVPQVFFVPISDPNRFKVDPQFRNFLGTAACCPNPATVDRSLIRQVQFTIRRGGVPTCRTNLLGANIVYDDLMLVKELPSINVAGPARPWVTELFATRDTSFTLSLASMPSHPVTLNVTSSAPNRVEVLTPTVTFTPMSGSNPNDFGDWDQPRTIQLRGLSDGEIKDTPDAVTISISVDQNPPTSYELVYGKMTIPSLDLEVRNSDTPPVPNGVLAK